MQLVKWFHYCSKWCNWSSDFIIVPSDAIGQVISLLFQVMQLVKWFHYCSKWCNWSSDFIIVPSDTIIWSSDFIIVPSDTIIWSSDYASPTSGEAYRDRRLTTNFELWVEIFCVPTCFHKRIPKPCQSVCLSVCPSVCPSVCLSVCPSVCPYPEKRNHHSFVNISPTLVIDTSMERSSRVLRHGNPKIGFFFFQKSSKFEFWLLTKSWNHLSFVNISPTLVIDTSMERSLRVLQHGNKKNDFFFFKKVQNSNFDFWRRAEITLASSISVLH